MEQKSTGQLDDILSSAKTTADLLKFVQSELQDVPTLTFCGYMGQMIHEHRLKKSDVIAQSGIQRNYGYQILNGQKSPGRDKVIALCAGAGLDIAQTQRALQLARVNELYSRRKRDAILIFAMQRGYSVMEINELLLELDEDALDI